MAGEEAEGSVAGGLHFHPNGLGKSYLRRGLGGMLRGPHKWNGSNWAMRGSRAGWQGPVETAVLKAVSTSVCASEEPTVEVSASWPHRRRRSRAWPHLPTVPGRWQTEQGGRISRVVIWLDPVLVMWPWAGNFTLWASFFLSVNGLRLPISRVITM